MPGKAKKATSKRKTRVTVKDLPAAKKKVSGKEMKRLKGGGGVIEDRSAQSGFILCRTNQGGVIICKNQASIILCRSKG